MGILKKIVDVIYGTNRVRKKYSNTYPEEKIFASDASKGIRTKEDKELERGMDWVASQRAVLILTDKRLKCGKWDIKLNEIEKVKLVKINTMFGSGQVLKVTTKNNDNYQFGMQMNEQWTAQSVLPMSLEKGEIKYSYFSIAVRIFLLGYFIYWLFEK